MEKSFHIAFNYKDFSASLEMTGKKKICKLYENEFIKLADDWFVRTQTKALILFNEIASSAEKASSQ